MEKQRNLLLAKKYMVESIYRSANIEDDEKKELLVDFLRTYCITGKE